MTLLVNLYQLKIVSKLMVMEIVPNVKTHTLFLSLITFVAWLQKITMKQMVVFPVLLVIPPNTCLMDTVAKNIIIGIKMKKNV